MNYKISLLGLLYLTIYFSNIIPAAKIISESRESQKQRDEKVEDCNIIENRQQRSELEKSLDNELIEACGATFNGEVDIERIKVAIAKGADVNATSQKYIINSPLGSICYATNNLIPCFIGKNIEALELLLQNGANVNFQNKSDYLTAVMLCAYRNNKDFVRILLCYGADVDLEDYRGKRAVDIANGHEMVKLLEDGKRNKDIAKFQRVILVKIIGIYFPKDLNKLIITYLPNEIQEYYQTYKKDYISKS